MNWLVYHIVSGHSFFTGIVLINVAAFASRSDKPIAQRIKILTLLIGVIAVATSSTAIPYWYYAIALIATVTWGVSWFVKKWRRWSTLVVIAVWALVAIEEVPYHLTPTLNPALERSITVIGDSVTAGIGGEDEAERWPSILARDHDLVVQDISRMGATAASALKLMKGQQITSPVVVLEIGGNDLLGSTSTAQFAKNLDALLSHVSLPGRQVIMFELPLPPFYHEYGRIQRSLAHKYNVSLIPKRVFLSIIASGDSTLDTIHLSQAGHRRMAECVWQLVNSAYPARDGKTGLN